MMALALQRIGHAYFGRTVLDAVDLCVGTGEVVALGPEATGVARGEHRVAYPWIGCGACGGIRICARCGCPIRWNGRRRLQSADS